MLSHSVFISCDVCVCGMSFMRARIADRVNDKKTLDKKIDASFARLPREQIELRPDTWNGLGCNVRRNCGRGCNRRRRRLRCVFLRALATLHDAQPSSRRRLSSRDGLLTGRGRGRRERLRFWQRARFGRKCTRHEFFDAPHVICDSCFHCRSHAQALVHSAKVVPSDVQ